MARPRVRAEAAARPRVARRERLACVLTIGGLDPGGGAGLLADARAIARAGAFPCAACALLTVQSTAGLRAAKAVAPELVLAQSREVLKRQRVRAIKTGALGSLENVKCTAALLASHRELPAVVDPVMLPTRGSARLVEERATRAMREMLVPRAALVTANAREAEVLTGGRVTRVSEAHDAALALLALGAKAALVKGGHLTGAHAIDVLAVARAGGGRGAAREVIELRAPRRVLGPTHGTGCVLASLVAGRIAADARAFAQDGAAIVVDAVRWSKRVHHRALGEAWDVGGELGVIVP